jgi:7-keto-8-aminopelargonate synthetase-like enzyme
MVYNSQLSCLVYHCLMDIAQHILPFSETVVFFLQVEKIDIITAGMGNALATDGGFFTGSIRVVDHQVGAIPD